jgi:hypothetical protein
LEVLRKLMQNLSHYSRELPDMKHEWGLFFVIEMQCIFFEVGTEWFKSHVL